MTLLAMNDSMTSKLLHAKLATYSPNGRGQDLPFSISDITDSSITFRKQNGKEQTARRQEIDFVSEHWESYKNGKISRKELQKKSFNTSYLFSVLHFLENELK